MDKKRHHYIPQAYLKAWGNADGKVFIHLKDDPSKIIHQTPDNTAFHKYFYSQPLPGGGRDNNSLEDFFSKVEDRWPPLIERLERRDNINDALSDLFEFVSLQRARVPAVRDVAEKMEAEVVRATALTMDAAGQLPPQPEGYPDLIETAVISIDPHRSIHAMPAFLKGMGAVLHRLGFGILHNITDRPFLTSDNPVVYFDPRVPEDKMLPYTIDREGGPVAFQMALTPKLMLYGYSGIKVPFARHGMSHADIDDPDKIEMFNKLTARFAYRAVFSQSPGAEVYAQQYAAESPVARIAIFPQNRGHLVISQNVFGPREKKLKWEG